MLALGHQAIAAEREFIESLFGLKSDGWLEVSESLTVKMREETGYVG